MKNINPNLDDFYEAYKWLYDHPYFFYKYPLNEPGFTEALDIMVVKVNPATDRIDNDATKNTSTRIWLEVGPWYEDEFGSRREGVPSHDINLDTEGATFEEAIKSLAKLVMEQRGDYPHYELCSHCYRRLPAGDVDPNEHWFCSTECADRGWMDITTEPMGNGLFRWVPAWEICNCSFHIVERAERGADG